MKRLIIVLVVMWVALLAPSYSQWSEAYLNPGGFTGLYFLDSLNGWFTHLGTDKIIHTSDGGYTFEVQPVNAGQYTLNVVYMEDELNGWSAGQGISGGPGIIHHTNNGGATWIQMNHPAPFGSGWAAIAKVDNSLWFCGTYGWPSNIGIIMKTSDNGQSWQVIEYPQFGGIANIYVFDSLNVLISGATGFIARTTNGGMTWVTANVPSYNVLDITFQDQNIGYCLVSNPYPPFNSYLYRTSDGGFTWNLHYSFGDLYKRSLSIIPNTNIIFVTGMFDISIGTEGILKSIDGGITWTPILEVVPLTVYKICTPDQYHGWVLVSSYVYRYDYVTPVVVEPISNKLIQFGESFTYQVNATGLGLKYSMTGNPSGLSIAMYSGLIHGTPTVGGKYDITVAVKDTDINIVNASFQLRVNNSCIFIPPFPQTQLYVDSLYQVQLFAADDDNDTLSFSALQKPDFLELITNPPAPINTATLQGTPAITDTGYHNISIMVSDGYGGADTLNWALQVIEFIPPVNHPPGFIGNWTDTVYVFRDSSYTWDFDFQDIDGDTLWAIAENIGVPGMNTEPNMGIGAVTLTITGIPADTGKYSAVVQVRDEHDSIGTVQFVVVVDIITSIDDMISQPSEFVLYQNYPNSFNPSTRIKYSIPELSFVTLKVYDVLGNIVATLIEENKNAGWYETEFNASELTSGVYFYRLHAANYIETKKMILIK